MHAAIVLGDVEIIGPWSELVRHGLVGRPKLLIRVAFLQQGVLWRIVAEQIEVTMGKVRLEANPARLTNQLQEIEHVFPRVHTTPADFTFHH